MTALRKDGGLLKGTYNYNSARLQLTGIALEKCTDMTALCTAPSPIRAFGYTFQTSTTSGNGGGPNNNGNVLAQTISDDGALQGTQSYGYDGFGELAVEYGAAVGVSSTDFVSVDHLGSTRAVVGKDGSVLRRSDYWPFGMELSSVDTAWRTSGMGFVVDGRARMKFTGHARDEGTGLDYFGARYFIGAQGRFAGPDAPFADQHAGDPQSWNLYSYVRNNPLRYTDPTGRSCLGALFGNHSAQSCADEVIGGAKAIANVLPGTATLVNRTINTVAGTNLPDAPMLNPSNPDQADGMNAANFVMLVSPLAEIAAGKLVELGRRLVLPRL